MDGREAYIRPSAAAHVVSCPGYAALNNALKAVVDDKDVDGNNEVREDGTACHWLAELLWSTQDNKAVSEGHVAPNGRTITAEMFDGVDMYFAAREGRPDGDVHVEQLAPVSVMFPGFSDGTPDRWEYDASARTLYVDDLKYGFRPVEAWRNWQLFVYALTIAVVVLKLTDPDTRVVLTIVQPRAPHREGPVRSWEFRLGDAGSMVDQMRKATAEAYADNPVCRTNPGCVSCAARFGCKAFIEQGMAALEFSHDSRPIEQSNEALSYYLQHIQFAVARLEALEEAVSTEMEWRLKRNGGAFPGYGMRSKLGNRQWNVGPETIATLATLFGKDLIQSKPVSPRQAEIAKLPASVIDMYSERRNGPLKLTRLDPNEAVKAFSKHQLSNWSNNNGK